MATASAKATQQRAPAKKGAGSRAVAIAPKKRSKSKALTPAEGSWRGPFYGIGELGNTFLLDPLDDGWQRGLSPFVTMHLPVVEAIRHLHRSAFAQLTPHHYEKDMSTKKIVDRHDTQPIRTLIAPNNYETWPEHASNVADKWVTNGEVLIWGIRNERTEVSSTHIVPWRTWTPFVDNATKAIFYAINQSGELLQPSDATIMVPARDVIHLRWATPRHPLIGEGPFAAAAAALGISVAMTASQLAFYKNQRRPSGILSTEQPLNKSQMTELRAAFDEQSKNLNAGGVPILAYGLKFNQMGVNPDVAKIIESQRMTNEEIARCAGVPPPLIGDLTHSAPGNTTEALMSWWLSLSLGGLIEKYERSYDRLFELNGRSQWIDFDTTELLRMELGKRFDALGKGVQNGLLTIDEARDRSLENLSPVEGGSGAFMQRQMTPVALLAELAAAELARATAPPHPPPGAPEPPAEDDDAEDEPVEDEEGDEDVARALSNEMIRRVKGIA